MKKVFIAFALTLCSLPLWAQPLPSLSNAHRLRTIEQLAAKDSYRYRLDEFHADDNSESHTFHYNDRQQLEAEVTLGVDYSLIDSLAYNAQGQLVRLSGWQLLGTEWKNVYYIDYTYDAAGNIASRSNYNSVDGVWTLGGVYEYSYNADNQIVRSVLTMSGIQFQRVEYEYAEGRLQEEVWFSYDGSGLSPDERLTYRYDAQGRLQEVTDSISAGADQWQYYGRQTYVYDARGNCTEYHRYDFSGRESQRSEYVFDDEKTLAETRMPWTPEMSRPETYTNTGVYVCERWYVQDNNYNLQHLCDFLYSYGDDHLGLRQVDKKDLRFYPNPAEDWVKVDGLTDEPARLRLVDMQGRVLMDFAVSGSSNAFSVKQLPAGCYEAFVVQNGVSRSGRLIVK